VIDSIVYTESTVETYDDVEAARDAEGSTWVRVWDANRTELDAVAERFGIHPLSVEDVVHDVRPKTEEFPTHTFVLVKTAHLRSGDTSFEEEVGSEQVGLFVGDDWLVTMSTSTLPEVQSVWDSIDAGNSRLLTLGPDFTAYRVIDGVVDDYFAVLDQIGGMIEDIETLVLDGPDPDVLEDLNAVRRDLLSIRKLLWPTREAVGVLARGDPEQVNERTEKYYRDVYDHLVQLVDLTETYRDLASGTRDIYLNTLSQSTNEVMKTLTVVATILLPLTFIVGVYGMNFDGGPFNMPELGWTLGYPAVMGGMGIVSLVMVLYFRSEGWL